MKVLTYMIIIFAVIVIPSIISLLYKWLCIKRDIRANAVLVNDLAKKHRFANKISATKEDIERYGLQNKVKLSQKESERVYSRLHGDLVKVFGDDYKNVFDLTKDYKKSFHEPNDCIHWANRLLLSKEGKVLPLDCSAYVGFNIGYETCEWNMQLCKIIETHLIDVHPDERDNIKMVLRKTYVNGDKFSGNMTFGIFNRKE